MQEELLQEEHLTMKDLEEHFDDANPWNRVTDYLNHKTILTVKIEGIVNGGAIAMVEGLRGFIPASHISLSYIENLETCLLQELEVRVIDVNPSENRLVLSAKEILKEKERAARNEALNSIENGTILSGVVESIKDYGAFIRLENGLSGLVHISQLSSKRVKHPKDVVSENAEVQVKVIGVKDGKISLSMKALEEPVEEVREKVTLPKSEKIGTNLGDLFKHLSLPE